LEPILFFVANDLNAIIETVDMVDNTSTHVDMLLYYNRTIQNVFEQGNYYTLCQVTPLSIHMYSM
jgi:hypothetical protein